MVDNDAKNIILIAFSSGKYIGCLEDLRWNTMKVIFRQLLPGILEFFTSTFLICILVVIGMLKSLRRMILIRYSNFFTLSEIQNVVDYRGFSYLMIVILFFLWCSCSKHQNSCKWLALHFFLKSRKKRKWILGIDIKLQLKSFYLFFPFNPRNFVIALCNLALLSRVWTAFMSQWMQLKLQSYWLKKVVP